MSRRDVRAALGEKSEGETHEGPVFSWLYNKPQNSPPSLPRPDRSERREAWEDGH